jgi:hypothetical protein
LLQLTAFGIVRNYPFNDGNKRAGFLAIGLFLAVNGLRVEGRAGRGDPEHHPIGRWRTVRNGTCRLDSGARDSATVMCFRVRGADAPSPPLAAKPQILMQAAQASSFFHTEIIRRD